jgi:hypothetical protein
MRRKQYAYFLVHQDGKSPPMSFYSNGTEARKDHKLYGGILVKKEVHSVPGDGNEVRKGLQRPKY